MRFLKEFSRYSDNCLVNDKPLEVLQLNEKSGRYEVLKQTDPELLPDNVTTPDLILRGRKCTCAPEDHPIYCPVGADTCVIQYPNAYEPTLRMTCYSETQGFWLRYIAPLMFFLFVFFGCLFFCSPKGKHAKSYCRKLVCCWSEERYTRARNETLNHMEERQRTRQAVVERYRQIQADRGRVVIPRSHAHLPYLESQISSLAPGAGMIELAERRVVVLKTKRYEKKQDHDSLASTTEEETGEEDVCSVCLNGFQDGDRVADIRCGHVFHVDCLKSWIQHKNHCPLCHMDEMASPQQDSVQEN